MAHLSTADGGRARARGAVAFAFACAIGLHGAFARSDDPVAKPPAATGAASGSASSEPRPVPWASEASGDTREGLDPFPSTGRYLSYGFSFHSESLLAPGGVCPKSARELCILGAGGGISFSGAFRAQSYSIGAVYEASFHDSNNIYQRGVLQQLRGEWRLRPHGWTIADSLNGVVGLGGGIATYGDNWTMATVGGGGHAFFGAEWDIGVKLSMSFLVSYRAIYFRAFDDPAFQHRPAGIVHLLGLQLGLELHEPL